MKTKITILLTALLNLFILDAFVSAAGFTLSLGKFKDIEEAKEVVKYLNSKDYPVYLKYGSIYEVRVGSFSNFDDASAFEQKLKNSERITASVVEDNNLESPLVEKHFEKKSEQFIIDREIEDYRKQRLVKNALSFIYHPYIYGGQKIGTGIDCSYFTKLVYQDLGIELPRTARYQFKCGDKIDKSNLEIGDLVFFKKNNGTINHVGIYFGNNEFIHATRGAKRVTISELSESYYKKHYAGARRVFKRI